MEDVEWVDETHRDRSEPVARVGCLFSETQSLRDLINEIHHSNEATER